MLVESERAGPSGEGPSSSAVVRARLLQLIRELQASAPAGEAPVGARYAYPIGVPRPVEDETGEEPGDDRHADDWLDRLRHPDEQPPVASDEAAPQPLLRRSAAQALAFGREHLAAVVVVLLVGVAWTAYSVLQARSSPVAAAAPVVQASPSATPQVGSSTSTSTSTSRTTSQVVVHVIGAVRSPGVVRLAEGSRVMDAITAAGGLSEDAAPGELNLAQVLADGVQLKVGTRGHPGGWIRDAAGGTSSSTHAASTGDPAKVALNSATLEQLDTLPGVGPVTAQKILDWRKAHGRFTATSELQEVDGIGPKTYADLADHVRL